MSIQQLIVFLLVAITSGTAGRATAAEPVPPHQSFTLESATLKETRRINVYTPPGYEAAGATRYPVLYMPDGGVQEDFPHIATTVDTAIRAGELRPLIVVGIENTERRRDMTGPTEVAEDRKIAPRVGGSAAFRGFIRDELMPQVRRRYRTTDETAIIGESLAGLFIVETFFAQPKLFGTYIALSPSLWWNNEELVRKAGERLKAWPELRNTLYLSSANEDTIAPQTARLAEALRTSAPAGLRWQYEPRPDLRHDTIYRSVSPQVLRKWFAPEATAAPPALSADAARKAAQIDRLMFRYTEEGYFTGAVLVSEQGKVLFKKGYGLANREWSIPNAPDTRFRLGSITKQFTSMLVMQQVQKGTIKLDAHLSDYLPYYRKDTGSRITIHQLLNHTSGIPSYTSDPKFFATESRNPYKPDEFIKKFCSGDLQFEPGSQYRYNNSGYFILGAILERITGKPYDVLLKQDILDPLGLKDTGYDHSSVVLARRASGYEPGLDGPINAPYLDMSLPYAAGALYSTVEDLFLWDQALYTDKLLRADLKEKLFTPGMSSYGYGWRITQLPQDEPGGGGTLIEHSGGINGFNTIEQRFVRDRALIVVLSNTPAGDVGEMARGIRSILYGREPPALKRSLLLTLGPTIARRGVEAAVAQYAELKRTAPNGYDFSEPQLNSLGYLLLSNDRPKDAIAIFKLNVAQYPKSGNVYDSLAEAYESAGQKLLAIENYRKSLEHDPNNQHGRDRLKELEGKERGAERPPQTRTVP